jgi:hypothetical protein
VKNEMRYLNTTAPIPEATPTTSAIPNSPKREPRNHPAVLSVIAVILLIV